MINTQAPAPPLRQAQDLENSGLICLHFSQEDRVGYGDSDSVSGLLIVHPAKLEAGKKRLHDLLRL